MLLHYLKITFRNISKEKFRYLLTTLGIAVGMVIFSIVYFFADGINHSWEKMPDEDRLAGFSTFIIDANGNQYNTKFHSIKGTLLSKALKEPMPDIESIGMIDVEKNIRYVSEENNSNAIYRTNIYSVNKDFLALNGAKFLKGTISEAWDNQQLTVIEKNLANKLFGNVNAALGKQVEIRNDKNQNLGVYTVTAVIEKINNPMYSAEVYIPINMKNIESIHLQAFARFKKNTDITKYNSALKSATIEKVEDASDANGGTRFLQLISYSDGTSKRSAIVYYGLLLMGSLVLIVALINFANLLIATMQVRIRQFTLRKIVGAKAWTFMLMLVFEILPILLTATFLSYLFLELLLNWYQSSASIPMEIHDNLDLFLPLIVKYPLKIAFWTLIASVLLAIILVYRIQKIILVQGIRGQFFKQNKNIARNVLLFLQLLFTIVIMSLSITAYKSAKTALSEIYQPLSKQQSEAVLIVSLNQLKLTEVHKEVTNRIKQIPGVLQTTTEFQPNDQDGWYIFTVKNKDLNGSVQTKFENYDTFWEVDNLLFKRELAPDEAIINQKFAEILERDTANTFWFSGTQYKVAGVVEQIPYTDDSKSAILINRSTTYDNYCLAKCDPKQVNNVKREIMKIIREYLPETVDYQILSLYDDVSKFSNMMRVSFIALAVATIFSLIITLLGIFTAVSYDTKRKRKEIAIRKINGATRKDIAKQFARLYAVLLVLAGVFGGLLHRFIMIVIFEKPTQGVVAAYTIGTDLIVWLSVVLIVGLTIFTQIQKALSENPAKILKSE